MTYSKELHDEIKDSMVLGDYLLGAFHNGHKNVMKNGSNVIDVNLHMTGRDNLYARELVTILNAVPDLLDEIDRLSNIETELNNAYSVLADTQEVAASLQFEVESLSNQWVSVSERPVIDDGEDRITVFVLWVWDSKPGELFPGIGQMFIDESKVMVSDGDFDKEVIYWQYIQPLPEVQS